MTDTLPHIRDLLRKVPHPFEILPCDDYLADTETFCAHYGASLRHSVNAILVKSRSPEGRFALCVVPAQARLDVNHAVRRKLGARKVSFASAAEVVDQTGMEIGGVTPLGVPDTLPVWVDESIWALDYVILGGGNRISKIKTSPKVLETLPNVEFVAALAKWP